MKSGVNGIELIKSVERKQNNQLNSKFSLQLCCFYTFFCRFVILSISVVNRRSCWSLPLRSDNPDDHTRVSSFFRVFHSFAPSHCLTSTLSLPVRTKECKQCAKWQTLARQSKYMIKSSRRLVSNPRLRILALLMFCWCIAPSNTGNIT